GLELRIGARLAAIARAWAGRVEGRAASTDRQGEQQQGDGRGAEPALTAPPLNLACPEGRSHGGSRSRAGGHAGGDTARCRSRPTPTASARPTGRRRPRTWSLSEPGSSAARRPSAPPEQVFAPSSSTLGHGP